MGYVFGCRYRIYIYIYFLPALWLLENSYLWNLGCWRKFLTFQDCLSTYYAGLTLGMLFSQRWGFHQHSFCLPTSYQPLTDRFFGLTQKHPCEGKKMVGYNIRPGNFTHKIRNRYTILWSYVRMINKLLISTASQALLVVLMWATKTFPISLNMYIYILYYRQYCLIPRGSITRINNPYTLED